MRTISLFLVLAAITTARAADLKNLPANTWVEIKFSTDQPTDAESKGEFARQGWNKIVFDPDGQRVLFYDRWIDKKHGGYTIYGNCLFGFDPAEGRLTPIKIDNWTKVDTKAGGYRTLALPENESEATPCPRHVYHTFDYVPSLKSVFICNGANQTALLDGKLVGHDLCDGAWQLDLATNKWTQLALGGGGGPPNRLDDAMAYCPVTHSIIYAGFERQLWILDLAKKEWRKAKQGPPKRTAFGETIFYDAPRQRMLIIGGGRLDAWKDPKAVAFRELYAFDPKAEAVERLADAPTAFYATHIAHDTRRDLIFAAAVFDGKEQPSGMFRYGPRTNSWSEVKLAGPIPPHKNWFGWMQMCYDSHHDCLIGKVNDKFFALRYEDKE